jgi:hypothetical protein
MKWLYSPFTSPRNALDFPRSAHSDWQQGLERWMDEPGSHALDYASFRKSYVRQSVYIKVSRFPEFDLLVEQHHMTDIT